MKLTSPFQKINWVLLSILCLFYLLFEILYVIKISYFVSLSGQSIPLHVLGAYAIDWVLVTSYMLLIAIHTSYLLERKVPWARIIPIHIFFSILISVVIRLVIDLYQVVIGMVKIEEYSFQDFIKGIMHSLDVNYLIYSAMIFIIYAFYYLEQVKLYNNQKRILETQLLDTRIKMLTTQLQPHFLFNTLNSISSLIDINKEKAQDTLADLSDFLRQILFHIDSNFVSIRKELEILSPYLNILKTRFHEKIDIKVSIPEDLLDMEIPNLILQPLIENAVKHGSIASNSYLVINLNISSGNERLFVEVSNSGKIRLDPAGQIHKGMGLDNLKNRLMSIYALSASFEIREEDGMVKCTVEIPLERGNP